MIERISAASGLPRVDAVPTLSGYYIATDGHGHAEFWSMRRHRGRNIPHRMAVWRGADSARLTSFVDKAGTPRHNRLVRLCALAWLGVPPDMEYIAVCIGNENEPTPGRVRWLHKKACLRRAGRPPVKLDAARVRRIKVRLAAGDGYKKLARDFGVNRTTIRDIKHGVIWRGV